LEQSKLYCERHCSATVSYTTPRTGFGAFLPGQREIREAESNTVTIAKMVLLQVPGRAIRRGNVSSATELNWMPDMSSKKEEMR
jgi:hypothetical protein